MIFDGGNNTWELFKCEENTFEIIIVFFFGFKFMKQSLEKNQYDN